MKESNNFNLKITKSIFIALLMLSGFALIIYLVNFFLVVFAGIFFSVLLNYASNWISDKLKIKYGFSLVIVVVLILGFFTGLIFLIGPSVGQQINELINTFPESFKNLKAVLSQNKYGHIIIGEIPDDLGDLIKDKAKAVSQVIGSFTTTLSVIANFGIIIVTGVFLAKDPKLYKNGFVSLFPVSFRPKLIDVLDKIHHILSLWMSAKLISITIVGLLTATGLQLLGIPVAYALALLVALCSFIPNIGPLLALIPALFVAFMVGVDKALFVILLYVGIELMESYLITPFFEKKIVSLPPALTLIWMVFCGLLAGVLGLILATPILTAVIIIVRELYVKGFLEKDSSNKIIEVIS